MGILSDRKKMVFVFTCPYFPSVTMSIRGFHAVFKASAARQAAITCQRRKKESCLMVSLFCLILVNKGIIRGATTRSGRVDISNAFHAKLYSASAVRELRIPISIQSNLAINAVQITTPACGSDSLIMTLY